MKKILICYFSGAATVIVIMLVFGYIFTSDNDYKIKSTEKSPDGTYVATLYTVMGGGAAGWCNIRVAVTMGKEKFNPEKEELYVYERTRGQP